MKNLVLIIVLCIFSMIYSLNSDNQFNPHYLKIIVTFDPPMPLYINSFTCFILDTTAQKNIAARRLETGLASNLKIRTDTLISILNIIDRFNLLPGRNSFDECIFNNKMLVKIEAPIHCYDKPRAYTRKFSKSTFGIIRNDTLMINIKIDVEKLEEVVLEHGDY